MPTRTQLPPIAEPHVLRRVRSGSDDRYSRPLLLRRLPAPILPLRPVLARPVDLLLVVTVFLALQFLIPARLVIGGLGAAGRPSVVLGLGLLLVWVAACLSIKGHFIDRQPVRWIIAAYLLTGLLSYGAGYARGLPPIESRAADRWVILAMATCGLALAIADGVPNRAVLDTMLRRLTHLTGAMAAVGILHALSGFDVAAAIDLPGLQPNGDLLDTDTRGDAGFARIAGTAAHYIEFGVVLAMVAPIAVHYAIYAEGRVQRVRRWSLAMLIIGAIPLSISRSGMLALGLGLAVLSIAWTWRTRLRAAAASVVATFVFAAIQPGLLGTIRSLFVNAEEDPSVQGRLIDYEIAQRYIAERPLLGRGPSTFLPKTYLFLDNEYLYTAIAGGLIGLLAFLGVLGGGYLLGRSVRLRGTDEAARHLGQAIAATMAVAVVSSGTFDAMSYPTFGGVLFLLLGAAGALWRIDRAGGPPRPPRPARPTDRVVPTPWAAHRSSRRPRDRGGRTG